MVKKIGRPTKYRPEMCDQVKAMGDDGMSLCEMSAELNISYETFYQWKENNPQFSEAVKDALRRSQAWWEKRGRQATFGEIQGFNATSYIFNMKNRFKEEWSDKKEHGFTNKQGKDLTDTELKMLSELGLRIEES